MLETFASRAFRRTATRDEVDRLVKIYELARKNGDRFERGIQLAMQATLMSPNFLFKVEFDRNSKTGEPNPINDFELATRLSYFLWSTMPDQELLDLAKEKKLSKPEVLDTQVKRMHKRQVTCPRRELRRPVAPVTQPKTINPDPATYPNFDESLRAAMIKETEAYFNGIKNEDRSIIEFLDSDYTYVNRRLARHYGITLPGSRRGQQDTFAIHIPDGRRGGVVTQAELLDPYFEPDTHVAGEVREVDSRADLEQPSASSAARRARVQRRQRRRALRFVAQADGAAQGESELCGLSCEARSARLRPGKLRWHRCLAKKDGQFPIDAAGSLPNGKSFTSPKELRAILLERKDDFTKGFVEKMMTYALGRGLDYTDRCTVDRIRSRSRSRRTITSSVG